MVIRRVPREARCTPRFVHQHDSMAAPVFPAPRRGKNNAAMVPGPNPGSPLPNPRRYPSPVSRYPSAVSRYPLPVTHHPFPAAITRTVKAMMS